jgi:hypothetical protein
MAVGKAIGWKVDAETRDNWEFRYTREEKRGLSSILIFDLIMPTNLTEWKKMTSGLSHKDPLIVL